MPPDRCCSTTSGSSRPSIEARTDRRTISAVPGIDDSDEAFERWYGPWDPFSVDQIA
jgi:hypothetical protein